MHREPMRQGDYEYQEGRLTHRPVEFRRKHCLAQESFRRLETVRDLEGYLDTVALRRSSRQGPLEQAVRPSARGSLAVEQDFY